VAHLLDLRLAQELDGAAGRLDLLARRCRDRMDAHGELLRHLADAEQLHVGARVLDQALLDERLGRHLVAGLETVEVAEVDRLGEGAERADRHRILRRRCRAACRAACRSVIWPPSKPGRILWEPERDFWPLMPRPE
jgi:hypothetical protein